MRTFFFFSLLLLVSSSALGEAFDNITPSVQIRHRFEYDNRDFDSTADPLTFSLLRSRVGLMFTPSEDLAAFVQLQDSRTMGEEFSTLRDGSADAFDLHQGYLKVHDIFSWPLDLKLGRMEVKYGSERLLGAVGWDNVGRAFDGLMLNLHSEQVAVDVFTFAEVESLRAGDDGDLNVFGFNADLELSEKYQTEVFVIGQMRDPSNRLNRYTIGFYSQGTLGDLRHETEFAYQTGRITPNNTKQDVQAFMGTLNLWYTFSSMDRKPFLSLGIDFLSGDDAPLDDKYKVFDTLYATNHKFYGFMDYFLNIPRDTFLRGLVDSHARAGLNPWAGAPLWLVAHWFRSQEKFTLANGSTSNDFGSEFDLTFKYPYSENLNFTLGASAFFPGEIFKEQFGSSSSAWFYIMTTLTI